MNQNHNRNHNRNRNLLFDYSPLINTLLQQGVAAARRHLYGFNRFPSDSALKSQISNLKSPFMLWPHVANSVLVGAKSRARAYLHTTTYGVRRQSGAATALWLILPRPLTPKRCPPKAFGVATALHSSRANGFWWQWQDAPLALRGSTLRW
jgi:hypothetical protein